MSRPFQPCLRSGGNVAVTFELTVTAVTLERAVTLSVYIMLDCIDRWLVMLPAIMAMEYILRWLEQTEHNTGAQY